MNEDDPVLVEEQAHLDELYKQLLGFRDDLTHQLEHDHKQAAADLVTMSEEIRPDFGGADETMETLAAIETLNAVIDAYNQYHDFSVDRLRKVLLLLRQPYFAKVRLKMRPIARRATSTSAPRVLRTTVTRRWWSTGATPSRRRITTRRTARPAIPSTAV